MRFVVLLTAVALAWPLAGQTTNPHVREGFWIGFGLGAGSAGASCTICSSDRELGLSGHFRLGATVAPGILLGAETNGWVKSEGGLDQTIGSLAMTGYLYPSPEQGLFLKAGLGLMGYVADDGVDELTAVGLGLQFGIGFDVRTGRNFSLVPYANVLINSGADAKFNGFDLGGDFNTNVVQFGLGLVWH